MQGTRHRPPLSLDASLFRTGSRATSYSQDRQTQATARHTPPPDASASGQDIGLTRLSRIRSFVKLSGGIGQAGKRDDDRESAQPPNFFLASPLRLDDGDEDDSGPLLNHTLRGGAKVSFTLDRHIRYHAYTANTSAWNSRNCVPAFLPQPFTPATPFRNPFAETPDSQTVPRSLLCFSLEIEPYQGEAGVWPKENFEFVSVQLDFKLASSMRRSSHRRNLSSPAVSTPYPHTPTIKYEQSLQTGLPIVRGFAPHDLLPTNFLQDFGTILYKTTHDQDSPEEPVVLGLGNEASAYRTFERRMSRVAKPIIVDGDRMTARGCQILPSACTTPAPRTFRQPDAPATPSTTMESAEYGTSSIRIMVRRDVEIASSWEKRKFPFIVLVEHPADAPYLEARIRLDATTLRKEVHISQTPNLAARRNIPRMLSLDNRKRGTWRSLSGHDDTDSGYDTSPSRSSSIMQPFKLPNSHTRSMSESSTRSSSGRTVEEAERYVKLYPRRDPISVISCGLGTVKDTLFQSGLGPRASSGLSASNAGKNTPRVSARTIPRVAPPTPRYDKPLPTPQEDPFATPPAPALPPRSISKTLYKETDSSSKFAKSYRRTQSSSNLQGFGSYGSSSEGSLYSQQSAERDIPRSFESDSSLQNNKQYTSRHGTVGSSWTNFQDPSPADVPPPPALTPRTSTMVRPRLVSRDNPLLITLFSEETDEIWP